MWSMSAEVMQGALTGANHAAAGTGSELELYTKPVRPMDRDLVGREKEILKLKAALCRPEYSNVILLANAGSGKAHPDNTLIPVADERGYVPIGDLKVGDFVFDENGKPAQVLGTFHRGMKRVFCVSFADGSKVLCNNEHLWDVRRSSARSAGNRDMSVYRTLSTQEIMDAGVHVEHTDRGPSHRWYVPVGKALQRPEREFPVDPYVIGVILGNGCVSKKDFYISSNDLFVVQEVARLLGSGYAKTSDASYSWKFPYGSEDGLSHKNWTTRDFCLLDPDGVYGFDRVFWRKSMEKRIPPAYLNGSENQRLALLQGLMDTDGTVSGHGLGRDSIGCSFSTNSPGLAEDFCTLVTSLGMRCSIYKQHRGENRASDDYSCRILCEARQKLKLFRLPRHRDKVQASLDAHARRYERHYDDIPIDNIEDLGYDAPMTCIWVDSRRHLYQVGKEHIVTHNTALVQGLMKEDSERRYLEVDLAKMIANLGDKNEMAARLKGLFDEVEEHGREMGQEIVLFIDEFHQVVQLSDAAVEALKPLLASSGNRGIKVIAATTLLEFNQYIAPNQPLVERLQRINLAEPGKAVTMQILQGFAQKYEVAGEIPNDALYELIYEYTNRYIPANAQPRKSILLLDAMVGYHRALRMPFGRKLLSEVLYQSEGINVSFKVDATKIKEKLDAAVYAQEWATKTISDALQVAVADLNDKSKPMCSFLFTGSTGVGKEVDDNEPIPVYTEDGSVHVKRNGDLKIGDFVFNRAGKPVRVTGVFPQGVQDVYEVELTDGRVLRVGDGHLWTYKSRFGNGSRSWKTADTVTLMQKCAQKHCGTGRGARAIKFVIPMNQAVEWPEMRYDLDPYALGAFIGNGCLTKPVLSFSSDDEEMVQKLSSLMGAAGYGEDSGSFNWRFAVPASNPIFRKGTEEKSNWQLKWYQTEYVFRSVPELVGLHPSERFIPEPYKHGSVDQRWALIQGLFDTGGHIGAVDGDCYNLQYCSGSARLVKDIQEVLYSLGISSMISDYGTRKDRPESRSHEYVLHVAVGNADKERFFTLSRKVAIAREAKGSDAKKTRVKRFGEVIGIRDIRKLPERVLMTCIMVDDEEHLYQAGKFIVTHNTQVTKALAGALFGSDRGDGDENQSGNRNLIRLDMSEYSQPSSVERFRTELTARIWERPFSIVLLDEIEKACGEVIRLLLQVLDDGRLTDAHERQVVFTNAYIVMTTNASANVFKDMGPYIESDTGNGEVLKDMMAAFRTAITTTQTGNKFPPELLGRIDAIIPFQPLSRKTIGDIVMRELKKLAKEVMTKHDVKLSVSPKVLDYIVEDSIETDTDAGGARQAIGKIRTEVTTPVAAYINAHPEATRLRVSVEGNGAWESKTVLRSGAHIVVQET